MSSEKLTLAFSTKRNRRPLLPTNGSEPDLAQHVAQLMILLARDPKSADGVIRLTAKLANAVTRAV
jgi:hypothetical protein